MEDDFSSVGLQANVDEAVISGPAGGILVQIGGNASAASRVALLSRLAIGGCDDKEKHHHYQLG